MFDDLKASLSEGLDAAYLYLIANDRESSLIGDFIELLLKIADGAT